MERLHYNPTASDDPILQELAAADRGKVFTTDSILSMLMCSNRSVYPWDIVLIRESDKLWMDKRDQGPLDYLSVNENASDPPMEITQIDPSNPNAIINTPSALSQQATFVNENFAWQVVKESPESRLDFDKPNPFYDPDESEPLASCGYRYRTFDLSTKEDEDINIVVRTEVDALLHGSLSASAAPTAAPSANSEEETFITIKTLFEFDSRAQGSGSAPDWRTKLDSQRGAVVATEMKNNSLKLARWATTSILAGAGGMKIGCVSESGF
jgi:translation initiation factor 3 subunit D